MMGFMGWYSQLSVAPFVELPVVQATDRAVACPFHATIINSSCGPDRNMPRTRLTEASMADSNLVKLQMQGKARRKRNSSPNRIQDSNWGVRGEVKKSGVHTKS